LEFWAGVANLGKGVQVVGNGTVRKRVSDFL